MQHIQHEGPPPPIAAMFLANDPAKAWVESRRKTQRSFRTAECPYFANDGWCPYFLGCAFAHAPVAKRACVTVSRTPTVFSDHHFPPLPTYVPRPLVPATNAYPPRPQQVFMPPPRHVGLTQPPRMFPQRQGTGPHSFAPRQQAPFSRPHRFENRETPRPHDQHRSNKRGRSESGQPPMRPHAPRPSLPVDLTATWADM
jgi:hypothetical protein